jgi:NAD(P)H-flavin reductase
MIVRQYLESLTKEELIELLKKLGVNDIIISGAFASTKNAIEDMIEKDFSNEVDEIFIEKR